MPSITAPAPSPSFRADCNWREAGFAVYVHWPFCQAKCPYCDFNSHVVDNVDQEVWRSALTREVERAAALTPGREVASVFFGGGTPSLMEPRTVESVLSAIARAWPISRDVEITLEANPTSVEAERFRGYRAAGINRLSLGVQALDDAALRKLGRLHNAHEARAALSIARKVFSSVSADLIYARQNQDLDMWRRELGEVLELGLSHLSLYQLTIEQGTVFAERYRRGLLAGLPDEELAADLYEATQEMCEAAGLPAYEVSNHAAQEGQSRHNLVYWRSGDWIGIGPGAVGRATIDGARLGSESPCAPGAWLRAALGPGGATSWEEVGDHGLEYLMMGMRLTEGVSLKRLRRLGYQIPKRALHDLADSGTIALQEDRLTVTSRGRPLLNGVLRALT